MPIRILLADDAELVRQGWKAILKPAPDMEVVGEVTVPVEAAARVKELKPDVVLMDLKWGPDETAGCAAIREIRQLERDVAIIAVTNNPHLIREARQAGADVAQSKETPTEELYATIRALMRRSAEVPKTHNTPPRTIDLTMRESEVLRLLVLGKSDKDIACEIDVRNATARHHVQNLLQKLGAKNRTQAADIARRLGLV